MINVAGVLLRITNDGGTDFNPTGIEALSSYDNATLVFSASAGKANTLYAHYAFRLAEGHRERVVADGGTVYSVSQAGVVLNRLRDLSLLTEASLIVPCESGKASVLYGINNLGVSGTTLDEATAVSFDAESDYTVTLIPDLIAERSIAGTEITLNVRNAGAPEVRYFKAQGVQSNFTTLIDVATTSDYEHEDTAVDAELDYKYKSAFVVTGTRNGSAREVIGGRSASVYVISESSTV